MSNHQLIQGTVFGTLLIVAVGCGSSANAGASGAGGAASTSVAGYTSTGGSAVTAGNSSAAGNANQVGGGVGAGGTGGQVIGTANAAGTSTAGGTVAMGGTNVGASTETLGQQCAQPGALACADASQKLSLVCGASKNWEVNQTCTGDANCDTRLGVTTGTCQSPDTRCVGESVGHKFCVGANLYACDANGFAPGPVENCTGVCTNGTCDNSVSACPVGDNVVSCAEDCGLSPICVATDGCYTAKLNGTGWYRTPPASLTCACSNGRRYMAVVNTNASYFVRVNVPEPWHLSMTVRDPLGAAAWYDVCQETQLLQCLIEPPNPSIQPTGDKWIVYFIFTDDPAAAPTNVYFEGASQQFDACP